MELEAYAREKRFPNPRFFVDDGYSGTNYDRLGFQEMLAEIEAGNVAVCITKDACTIIGLNQKDPENRGFQGLVLLFLTEKKICIPPLKRRLRGILLHKNNRFMFRHEANFTLEC